LATLVHNRSIALTLAFIRNKEKPMIKFFRKIRYDLMEKNKTSKYLKYAIGEIVLVVIGILIALQINSWNQQRIQNKEEQQALINLKQDFEYNYSSLDSILTRTNKAIELQLTILNHTGNKPDPETEAEFNVSLGAIAFLTEYYPRNGYLNDLLNSGKLGILKNPNLRNRLSSWNSVLNHIKQREFNVQDEIEKINDDIIKKGSWLNIDAVSTDSIFKNNPFPKSGFDIDNRVLLGEIEFENKTENVIYQNKALVNGHKTGLILLEEILELIEMEINN